MRSPLFTDVTAADLNGWSSTAHGCLAGLPEDADVLITDGDGDLNYTRFNASLGQMWITAMTLEWSNVDPDVLRNELALAGGQPLVPAPIPAAALLGVLGMATAGLRLRRFV